MFLAGVLTVLSAWILHALFFRDKKSPISVLFSAIFSFFIEAIREVYLFVYRGSLGKLPPGPKPYPLIGNVGTELHPPMLHLDLERLSKTYEKFFTIHLPFPVVNICDFETLRDTLLGHGDDFSGRMQSTMVDMFSFIPNGGIKGITLANGDSWKEQRRVALSILRDFGMGKNLMEEKVKLSIMEYLQFLKTQDLDRCDLKEPMHLLVANVIIETLFGYSHKYDDCAELFDFVHNVEKMFDDAANTPLFFACMLYPWLKHVPFLKESAYYRHKRNWDKLQSYIVKKVDEAVAMPDTSEEAATYVHAYLRRGKDNANLTYGQLVNSCTNLFLAGQESTSITLRWITLYLAAHQDVQDRVRDEIFRVVGRDRLPALDDRVNMPYTIATIHEVQRRANIGSIVWHNFRRATVDTHIADFPIPKDTLVNIDLHQILAYDPHFVNPTEFNPDRYIAEDGVTLRKEIVERSISFGIGKRSCVGEGLARVELFLGITATLQHYRLLPPLDGPVDLEPIYYNVHVPKPHKLQLVPV